MLLIFINFFKKIIIEINLALKFYVYHLNLKSSLDTLNDTLKMTAQNPDITGKLFNVFLLQVPKY